MQAHSAASAGKSAKAARAPATTSGAASTAAAAPGASHHAHHGAGADPHGSLAAHIAERLHAAVSDERTAHESPDDVAKAVAELLKEAREKGGAAQLGKALHMHSSASHRTILHNVCRMPAECEDVVRLLLEAAKAAAGAEYETTDPYYVRKHVEQEAAERAKKGSVAGSGGRSGGDAFAGGRSEHHRDGAAPTRHHETMAQAEAKLEEAEHSASESRFVALQTAAWVGQQDRDGFNALHYAARNGHDEVVEMLLAALEDRHDRDRTAKRAALTCRTRDGWTPLSIAVDKGHAPTVQKVLQASTRELGAVAVLCDHDSGGMTPVHRALHHDNLALSTIIINYVDEEIARATNDDGQTPLHVAAQLRRKDAAMALVEVAPDVVHVRDGRGRTPLHWACESGDAAVAVAMLKAGAKYDSKSVRDDDGKTPRDLAHDGNHASVQSAAKAFYAKRDAGGAAATSEAKAAAGSDGGARR